MYAGTKVNWHEVLMPDSNTPTLNESLPLFLCAFSADKGSEEITDLDYSGFKSMYGNSADFFKYGQPLIQAHNILAAGGRVLGKRIVADNSKLANLVITAEVTDVEENKKNAEGVQLYIDDEGRETTTVTGTPATNNYAKIKYSSYTTTNAKSLDEVENYAATLKTETKFPLFIICDNGRGASVKKVRFTPDYEMSKKSDYMIYKISDIEDASNVETIRFSIYPNGVNTINGVKKNMLLTPNSMVQLRSEIYSDGMDAFLAKVAEITGYTVEDLYGLDVLFAKTLKQKSIDSIKIDETGLDISVEYGLELQSGDNGSFGDKPFPGEKATDQWGTEAVKFFNGTYSEEIFDLDQHKIDFCVDANYPDVVKAAIANLVDFREDFFYLRDMGLDINSIYQVQSKIESGTWHQSPFIGDYLSRYETIDRFSHKQIRVTMMHGLAPLLVNHYLTNTAAPMAGEFNNFVISEAIYGTLNVIPRITPTVDQKEILDDLKVNYVNYTSDGLLAVQSSYTSQDHEGPLSYSGNVVITQMVIKAIREYCPKIRFMLMDPGATDFGKYKTLIEDNVIARFSQYFKSIELIYTADAEQVAAKIFNASLYCYYRDYPQGEIFDVFAIEGSPENNTIA